MMPQLDPLDRYKILHELGRGAIGRVYAARDRSTGAVVALKTLDPALFSEPDGKLAELFLKNARSAARLRHRNIVKILDAGEAGGTAFVAMELLEGESLRQLLDARPLPIARAIQIFDDVASALAYAHEEGMVHRGVKPSNIIVLPSGVTKLGDFGIGQIGEAALRYMSPEQVRGDPVDHRSDIFSLGAVFYEMLTRRALFEGSSPKEIMENILHAEPPSPSEVNPHVPGALDGIVSGMLARQPEERFANARVLLRDLHRLQEGLGLGPGASAGTGAPTVSTPPDRVEPRLRTPGAETQVPQVATEREPTLRTPDHTRVPSEAFDEHDARFFMDRPPDAERSPGSRAARFAAIAVMVAVLFAVVLHYSSRPSEPRPQARGMQEAPATAAAPQPATALEPVAARAAPEPLPPKSLAAQPSPPAHEEPAATAPAAAEADIASAPNTVPPKPLVTEPSPPVQAESLPTRKSEPPAAAAAAPVEKAPRAAQPTAKIPEPQPAGTAKLIVAVAPQGELYIDGKHYGTTPPITTLDLEPGMHRIEIRSGSWKPYLTYMAVQAGDERRIRHDFAAKPSRPPK